MGAYIKISSDKAGSCNSGLKQSIVYIGKKYGRLANKEGATSKQYLKSGIAFVAKKFGRMRHNAIKYMIFPKRIKNSTKKQWNFNKQTYARAFSLIVDYLLKAAPEDKEYVYDLLNKLYQDSSGYGDDVERICSDALIYWQKKMLSVNRNNPEIGEDAGIMLRDIERYDKPLPQRHS